MNARHIFYDSYGLRIGWFVTFMLPGMAAFAAAIFVGVLYGIARPTCTNTADALGVDHRWGVWAGCLVSVDEGRWFPLDQYRIEVGR